MNFRTVILIFLCLLAVGGGFVFAIRRNREPSSTIIVSNHQNIAPPAIHLKQQIPDHPSEKNELIQNAIEQTLKSKPELFANVHLLDIHVEDGNVAINLSHDFLQLDTLGDTGESMAQNALCDALSQFQGIRKLTVMVDGTIYQGEHYGEWADIPIRAANDANRGDR